MVKNENQDVAQETLDAINKIKEKKQWYMDTFESDSGKEVLADLKRYAFFYKSTMQRGVTPEQMAFNEGMRAVVLHMENMMKVDLEATEQAILQNAKQQ